MARISSPNFLNSALYVPNYACGTQSSSLSEKAWLFQTRILAFNTILTMNFKSPPEAKNLILCFPFTFPLCQICSEAVSPECLSLLIFSWEKSCSLKKTKEENVFANVMKYFSAIFDTNERKESQGRVPLLAKVR